ncbi:MAG TPA: peptide-N4-asparagine amidase [Terriglobales bacterium]|nr:peptide-N4-asparagine amidase [Terriglobales bacterium]
MPLSLSKFAATFVSSLCLLTAIATAQLQIGSSNTATADPTVPRPKTTPCVVTLYKQLSFIGYTPQSFNYAPPASCPGPWAKVILAADFSVSKGIQFDRTANIWIGPANIYFGTTSEPDPNDGRHWHVERDLTDYSSIFTVAQVGTVDLGNTVNRQYTGILHGTAKVLFYPLAANQAPPRTADQVIAFSGGPTGGTVGLGNGSSLLEQTLTFPTNITDAYFDVFAQSQSGDEFWYVCVPNDVAGELESCGGTAFRESEVTIDGTPAGVAPVYPWIYTGGIDPFLWIPIPGVQTLNFQPYRVNLTPFASLLDDGQPHTVALSVFNANNYFSATASLLLYTDANATQITGAVTENTLAVPAPDITEHIGVAQNGNVQGTVDTKSGHNFQISGYINTPVGPVTTTVAQNIQFFNNQYFKILPASYEQNVDQGTTIHSVVTTHNAGGTFTDTTSDTWPFKIKITLAFNADGSGTQTTTSNQYFERSGQSQHKGQTTSFNLLKNRVIATDGLDFDPSFNITGNQNQASSQDFFRSNSTGYCYSRNITASAGLLTTIADGEGCN